MEYIMYTIQKKSLFWALKVAFLFEVWSFIKSNNNYSAIFDKVNRKCVNLLDIHISRHLALSKQPIHLVLQPVLCPAQQSKQNLSMMSSVFQKRFYTPLYENLRAK